MCNFNFMYNFKRLGVANARDHGLEVSLSYIVRPYLKKSQNGN
jgi:hypothetical protein